MRMRFWIPAVSSMVLLASAVTVQSGWFGNGDDTTSADIAVLGWEDLLPADFVPPEDPTMAMSRDEIELLWDGSPASNRKLAEIEETMSYAPTVASLDGQRVKVPGYVVPLDFDGNTRMKEFLLVPFYGACIHVPPPPANQVVHANSRESIEVANLYEPVWAIGTMKTETTVSNLAEAGYSIDIERVVPYDSER